MNVESLTHSQPQRPSTQKYKQTIRLTAELQWSVPSKGSWYTSSLCWMKSQARNTCSNNLDVFFKHMSTVKSNRKLCTTYFPSSLLLLGSELTQGLTDRDFRAM